MLLHDAGHLLFIYLGQLQHLSISSPFFLKEFSTELELNHLSCCGGEHISESVQFMENVQFMVENVQFMGKTHPLTFGSQWGHENPPEQVATHFAPTIDVWLVQTFFSENLRDFTFAESFEPTPVFL